MRDRDGELAPLLDELRRPVSVDLEGVTPQRALKVLVGLWTLVYSFSKTVHSRDKITHDETSHGPAHTLVFLAGAFAASAAALAARTAPPPAPLARPSSHCRNLTA